MIDTTPTRKLGAVLKAARLAQGLAIQQVAARAHMTDTEYQRLEDGRSLPVSFLKLSDLEIALSIKKGSLSILASQYKVAMAKFIATNLLEIQALVFSLKQYSSYDIESILEATIQKWSHKSLSYIEPLPDEEDDKKKSRKRRQVVNFDQKGKKQ